jgi:hypothetical protein
MGSGLFFTMLLYHRLQERDNCFVDLPLVAEIQQLVNLHQTLGC